MKIVVLGGRGQLGCSFAKLAPEYEWAEMSFADLPETDICDIESVERVLDGADIVINCAAWTAVDRAEVYFDKTERVNREGARIVAKTAQKFDIPIIYISTDYVFDGTAKKPYKESAKPSPLNVYGMTKLAGERAVAKTSTKAVIVRTSWLYSEFGHNFVHTMLRLGRERGEVRVVNDQMGSPTYATDLVRGIMSIIERGINEGCEIYHYCNRGATSWYDFAVAIFNMTNESVSITPVTTEEYLQLARRPAYSVLNTEKTECLGVAIPTWEDALKRCLSEIEHLQFKP